LIVSLCSLAAAAAMVRAGLLELVVGGIVDGAVRNIITLILGFSALMSAVLWFVRESGHSPALKRGLACGLLGLVALGLATLRVERVSGDLVPEFRRRHGEQLPMKILHTGGPRRGLAHQPLSRRQRIVERDHKHVISDDDGHGLRSMPCSFLLQVSCDLGELFQHG
jgi:hypothetical protein